jgi:serine/threonine protein kinase
MIGKEISHYKILEKLGEGGMGVVYKAEDTKLKRTVAIKFLPSTLSADKESKTRFINEARTASALDHPNICIIYEIGETKQGQSFIAMACYDGETLKEKIKDQRLKIKDAIDLTIQIAKGLVRAHEEGIVHRDIKPANIMITNRGELKILDFGLAKLAGQSRLTRTGTTMGTVAYMSPEQARGETVDNRTDIWSLGVVLYELITGEHPFKGDYDQALIYNIINQDPRPLTEIQPNIPEALNHLVLKALSKNPDERPPHLHEILKELLNVSEKLIPKARPEGQSQLKQKQSRRSTNIKIAGYLLVLLVIFLLMKFFLSSWGKTTLPYDLAILPLIDPEIKNHLESPARELQRQLKNLGSDTKVLPYQEVSTFYTKQQNLGGGIRTSKLIEDLGEKTKYVMRWEINRLGKIPTLSIDLLKNPDWNIEKTFEYQLSNEQKMAELLHNQLVRDVEAFFFSGRREVPFPAGFEQYRSAPITWSPEAARLFIRALKDIEAGDDWEAYQLLRQALEKDPEFAQAYGWSAYLVYNLALPYSGSALSLPFTSKSLALKNRLEKWEVEMYERVKQFLRGEPSEVVQSIDSVLISKLGRFQNIFVRTSILAFQRRMNELLDFSLAELTYHPGPFSLWILGPVSVIDLDYLPEKVLTTFQPLLQANPNHPMPHLTLGACLIIHPEYVERAEQEFNKVLALTDGIWQPRHAWVAGKMELYAGRLTKAEEILRSAIFAKHPGSRFSPDSRLSEMSTDRESLSDPRLYAFLSWTYLKQNKLSEAEKFIELYRQILSENPWIDYHSGKVNMAAGNPAKAIEDFNNCSVKDKNYPWLYYQRGKTFESMGNRLKAIQDLKHFVDLMGPKGSSSSYVKESLRIIDRLKAKK